MALSTMSMVTELVASMAPFFFTSVAILFAVLVYFYTPYWSVRRIPGPPTTPLLGHLPLMSKYGADAFTILARRYGPIYRFHMGRQPLVVIADPELCKEVGIKKFKDVGNRSIPSPLSGSPLHQKGLLFTRDSRWSTMRNTITSLHQPSHISSQISIMQEVVNSMSANFPNSEQEDIVISDLFFKMSTDIIGRSAFGFDFGLSKQSHTDDMDSHASDFIKQHIYSTTTLKMDLAGSLSTILGLLFPIIQEPFRQILKRIPRTTEWKTERTNTKLTRWLEELVAKRSENQGDCTQSKDLLTLLLSARESKKASKDIFTSDYISALAYEHLLAGSVTTSFTISTILYLVAGCPEVEEKLIKEIDDFGPCDSVPTAQDLLHKFPYLDQVIKEAMRFYTVSPLVVRETSRQIEIGGYILPKGTFVCLANGVLAKDPKQFPEPEKFKPERFDPNCEEEKQRHPYANIPFGIGPRACIGIKFAMQELRVAIVHLYQRFIFRHSPDMEKPLAIDYGVDVNFKYGVKLRVIKRR